MVWLLKEEQKDYSGVDPAQTVAELSELKKTYGSSSRAFFNGEFGTEAFLLSTDH